MINYTLEIETKMKNFYKSLSEKDQRRYIAIESLKLPRGGKGYICKLFGCDLHRLQRGLEELDSEELLNQERIRLTGGGRKDLIENTIGLNEAFLKVLQNHTAGSPMDENTKWTNLSHQDIADYLAKDGFKISVTVVKKLLKKNNFRKRKPFKNIEGGNSEFRNEQFENIEKIRKEYEEQGNPIVSMDVKKKELIGEFSRDDEMYTQERVHVNDHDFLSMANGIAIPHAIYDIKRKYGYITIGTSCDTSEFACDCIENWWNDYGKKHYPQATSIMILCDGGGSNSSHYYIFKEKLQEVANKINIEIRIAHYPPYTSKYNPIEHLLFPHVTRACKGLVFKDIEIVKSAMENTKTKTGLQVAVSIVKKIYEKGKKVVEGFKENMPIIRDTILPNWNYTAVPQKC